MFQNNSLKNSSKFVEFSLGIRVAHSEDKYADYIFFTCAILGVDFSFVCLFCNS